MRRVTAPDAPYPMPAIEHHYIPDAAMVVRAVQETLASRMSVSMNSSCRMLERGSAKASSSSGTWRLATRSPSDQIICDVQTDKAIVELPSPVTGTVSALGGAPGRHYPGGGDAGLFRGGWRDQTIPSLSPMPARHVSDQAKTGRCDAELAMIATDDSGLGSTARRIYGRQRCRGQANPSGSTGGGAAGQSQPGHSQTGAADGHRLGVGGTERRPRARLPEPTWRRRARSRCATRHPAASAGSDSRWVRRPHRPPFPGLRPGGPRRWLSRPITDPPAKIGKSR